jgi:hypothetical protein
MYRYDVLEYQYGTLAPISAMYFYAYITCALIHR